MALAEGAEANEKADAEKVKQESTAGEEVREKLKADMGASQEKREEKDGPVCEDCQ